MTQTLAPAATAAPASGASSGRPARDGGRALVWDSTNTSALLNARALCRAGWTVDWVGSSVSPWRTSRWFNGDRTVIGGPGDPRLLDLFRTHPLDVLVLHGDDQVRWCSEQWNALPRLQSFLPRPESLRIALSKERSAELAARLGVPVLPTVVCETAAAAAAAGNTLAPGGEVVLKGEGGAAGAATAAARAGIVPPAEVWVRVSRRASRVLVQRRITGPKVFLSVVYEHGREVAACAHEKAATFPHRFGPTAFGVTRNVPEVLANARRLFGELGWHGPANIEFRQDTADGRWYFMEINPRMGASMGIQEAAGIDFARIWAEVCTGELAAGPSHDTYRDGVRFAWTVRGVALALRRPWNVPVWGLPCVFGAHSDFAALEPPLRRRALKLAAWTARHA